MEFQLIGRSYCSLCARMKERLLLERGNGANFVLREIDVDDDERLLAQYDELVPVLLDPQGREVCHWRLDVEAFRRALLEGQCDPGSEARPDFPGKPADS